MIPFPKRMHSVSVERVELDDFDPEDLADTTQIPSTLNSVSPMAIDGRAEGPRLASGAPASDAEASGGGPGWWAIATRGRPSLPWGAVLVTSGAVFAVGAMQLIETIAPPPLEASAAAPILIPMAVPLTPPTPPREPTVLTFAPSDAVTVALPHTGGVAQVATATAAVVPSAASLAASAVPSASAAAVKRPAPPADSARADHATKPQGSDALANKQLKAPSQ